jgi:hypothetical protein
LYLFDYFSGPYPPTLAIVSVSSPPPRLWLFLYVRGKVDAALLLPFRRPHPFADSTEHQRDPLIGTAPPCLIKSARIWTAQTLLDAAGGNAKQS